MSAIFIRKLHSAEGIAEQSNGKLLSQPGQGMPDVQWEARQWWHSGRRPLEFFMLTDTGTGETCLKHPADPSAVLLFTDAMFAAIYARDKRWNACPLAIPAFTLSAQANRWTQQGLANFALDPCPRCPAANFVSLDILVSPEEFAYVWAVTLLSRKLRKQQFAGCAFQSLLRREPAAIVPKLKELRDHVDPTCPAVHYALALLHITETPDQRHELLAHSRHSLLDLGRRDLAEHIPCDSDGLKLAFTLLRQMAEGDFDLAWLRPRTMTARAGTA